MKLFAFASVCVSFSVSLMLFIQVSASVDHYLDAYKLLIDGSKCNDQKTKAFQLISLKTLTSMVKAGDKQQNQKLFYQIAESLEKSLGYKARARFSIHVLLKDYFEHVKNMPEIEVDEELLEAVRENITVPTGLNSVHWETFIAQYCLMIEAIVISSENLPYERLNGLLQHVLNTVHMAWHVMTCVSVNQQDRCSLFSDQVSGYLVHCMKESIEERFRRNTTRNDDDHINVFKPTFYASLPSVDTVETGPYDSRQWPIELIELAAHRGKNLESVKKFIHQTNSFSISKDPKDVILNLDGSEVPDEIKRLIEYRKIGLKSDAEFKFLEPLIAVRNPDWYRKYAGKTLHVPLKYTMSRPRLDSPESLFFGMPTLLVKEFNQMQASSSSFELAYEFTSINFMLCLINLALGLQDHPPIGLQKTLHKQETLFLQAVNEHFDFEDALKFIQVYTGVMRTHFEIMSSGDFFHLTPINYDVPFYDPINVYFASAMYARETGNKVLYDLYVDLYRWAVECDAQVDPLLKQLYQMSL